jgi:Chromo (CHRromatin Organisation MOdifier) domain
VSQLKGKDEKGQQFEQALPLLEEKKKIKMVPVVILGRRMTPRKNKPVPQVLIRWYTLPDFDATWEDYEDMRMQFPEFVAEDSSNVKGELAVEGEECKLAERKMK